jgi:effector-binding domain-containing protein
VKFDKVGEFYANHFPSIMQSVGQAKLQPSGPPSGVYYKWDEQNGEAELAAAIPVSDPKAKVAGYETISLPASKALKVEYYGAYDKSMDAHMAIDSYMKEKGMTNGNVIEEYVTDPGMEKDTAKWLTNIYYLVSSKQ